MVLAACAVGSGLPGHAQNEAPFAYTWKEAYFPSFDGTRLHADILRDPAASPNAKQPVILTVSPYTNHASQAPPDYWPLQEGPSNRFFDFLEQSHALARGYTYVIVDLRGFGGSAGCTDWGGPGEQGDVKAAVEWAGSQPWSNGRVGVFGKSYDGWTGLMAIANRPKHLAAVVSMEPVYDGYRYLYNNGVRFQNVFVTPALFVVNDATPGGIADTPEYLLNGTSPNAACYVLDYVGQQNDDDESAFWQDRELIRKSRGATTPLFLTQGFLESNTLPDGAFSYFNGLAGPKWAWFGQWDHVRGYEKVDDEFAVGRDGFLAEAMRFFDRFVKGLPRSNAPIEDDPSIVVQSIDGRFRSERSWPPADATLLTTKLRVGSYTDNANNYGDSGNEGNGKLRIWSVSQPLRTPARLAGEPVFHASLSTLVPHANLVANVYDIDPKGRTLMISRGAMLLRSAGEQTVSLRMYGQDWLLPAGHRVGVTISGANSEWWQHIQTETDVVVKGATIDLPFLRIERTGFLHGTATPRLESVRKNETFSEAASTLSSAATTFVLPSAMQRPATAPPAPSKPGPAARGDRLPATGVPAEPLLALSALAAAAATGAWRRRA